ncbi:MAG TPA: putative baseplate assembly protein [Caldimonas sp.]|nr:putative baseplate assembly protein [Caldimonas sp.]
MIYHCCDLRRLNVLRTSGSANAIEFIEVLDRAAPAGVPRQRTLFVRLLHAGFALAPANLRIDGGERVRTVGVEWCAPANALPAQAEPGLVDTVDDLPRTLVVRTDGSGDHSLYTFSLVANVGSSDPPAGFDPKLASIAFSFKVECPSDFDCAAAPACPPRPRAQPDIDYLAKDYDGFRRLMLDRMSLLVPGWTERSAADIGTTLVELLAYAADNLSYRQDAIANEAYLATARQRVSVRRHARLVDYHLHEGCNARAFVHFDVVGQAVALPAHTPLLTLTPNLATEVAPGSRALREAIDGGALVFETAHDATLDERLNQLAFYTWGDAACCLTRGATKATLRGHVPLNAGDLLIFEEVVSPTTFTPADADRTHRWAVRLTQATPTVDPSGRLFDAPPVDAPLPITEIAWDVADALPFPLCLSVHERPGLDVSVALGNIVLVDHGLSVPDEPLPAVPASTLQLAATAPSGCCNQPDVRPVPPRYRPALQRAPLTHGFDLAAMLDVPIADDEAWWPASTLLAIAPHDATPRIALVDDASIPWTAQRDLIDSDDTATDFVVEVEDSGRARLRFGDDANGKRPDPGTSFKATYRIGNGTAGNVGADTIAHIVSHTNGVFTALRNPLPAAGGVEPEDIAAARRDAPQAFRTQERAVTPADYAAAAERRPDVQHAAATFRWTGSWYTVFVTADRFGGGDVDAGFKTRLRRHLERFRMAGYDLDVDAPRYVPLDVALHVCVKPDYFRADVLHAVQLVLSSEVLADGTLGVFHPDNFTFAQDVYLSRIVAAAQSVEGVDAVRAQVFQRLIHPDPTTLDTGVIAIGAPEIAQLANNPNFPERGRLVLQVGGGK